MTAPPPVPWPAWRVRSARGRDVIVYPPPCPRCDGPALAGHTCPDTTAAVSAPSETAANTDTPS